MLSKRQAGGAGSFMEFPDSGASGLDYLFFPSQFNPRQLFNHLLHARPTHVNRYPRPAQTFSSPFIIHPSSFKFPLSL